MDTSTVGWIYDDNGDKVPPVSKNEPLEAAVTA